ncbi:MAG: membrane protein insertase YidC [Verrucomicrobia bacterium]|jgi:YidC/Oxa1 family membrane protein insertase|nr:membrane protein insertase YidC [Verrucomicrobiota bacterium]|tara:strand:+ start:11439 stop:13292 length:1854 start_codon:yes stop_codon:yes gene_type:complete
MYDRKTWIILALCGVLIAINMHFASKNEAHKRANEPAAKETVAPLSPAAPAIPEAGLTEETPPPPTSEETVVLENDKVAFTLSNIGGGIKYAELKEQKNVTETSNVRINKNGPGPIAGLVGPGEVLDNATYSYKADQSEPGKTVVFIAKLSTGIIAKKTFSLETSDIPGAEYFLNFSLALENTTQANFDLSQYDLFLGSAAPLHEKERSDLTGFFWYEGGKMHFKSANSFKGGFIGSDKYILDSPSDEEIVYAGVSDQFFITVIRPEKPEFTRVWGKPSPFTLKPNSKTLTSVRGGLSLPEESLAPGVPTTFNYQIFIGPKANTMLRKLDNAEGTGEGWGDMMQYGWFWFVSRPLNWLLNNLHNLLDNLSSTQSWGFAIICLTIIVRIFIWPLHAKSTHSMKRMSKLQPVMKELKAKYPDDPNKLNTEMMGLYRKYGINPLGGCLPMFIQIPIFFGFFKMLNSAVELRDQPFLWVNDLSQPDTLMHIAGIPLNILPIVMAGTSAIQMSLMPKTGDKMQQRIMLFMPLMFFFFCYNYASALALYWTTQNIFSIGQTYLMNKIPEPELKARKDGGKKSWVQRMAEKQAEMQKQKGKGGDMRNVTPDKPKKKGQPRTGGK